MKHDNYRVLKAFVAIPILLLLFSGSESHAANKRLPPIHLLFGYKLSADQAVDATAWTIQKPGGVTIEFEAGMNEGSWADPKNIDKYAFYKEQVVNGYKVRLALIKRGLKTVFDSQDGPGDEPGNILLVTSLLDGGMSDHTADFKAKIKNEEQLTDALLMILTFDPNKGTF